MKNKNKIQKQKQPMSKKRKIFLIGGVSLAVAAAVAVPVSLVLTNQNRNPDTSQNTISFSAGTNSKGEPAQFTSENKSINFDKQITWNELRYKTPSVWSDSASFVGWAKSSAFKNNKVELKDIITPFTPTTSSTETTFTASTNLRAVFKDNVNDAGLTWTKITFKASDTEFKLAGVVTMEVPANVYYFNDINKPVATPLDSSKIFAGWYDYYGNEYKPNTVIAGDKLILYAKLGEGYKLTFDANGGEIITGTGIVSVKIGQLFGEINKPQIGPGKTGETPNNWVFKGWYDAATGGKAYTPTSTITVNSTIYAQWETNPAPTETSTKVKAINPDGKTGFSYDSSAIFMVEDRNLTWKEINHPNPLDPTVKVKSWEYQESDTELAQDPTTGFIAMTDETKFTKKYAYVRPVLEPKTIQVLVRRDQNKEDTNEYKLDTPFHLQSLVFPLDQSQICTWKVFNGTTELVKDTDYKLEIDTTEQNKAALTILSTGGAKDLTAVDVQVTTDDEFKVESEKLHLTKTEGTKFDAIYFVQREGVNYRVEGICSQDSDITVYDKTGTLIDTKTRAEFNEPVYISEKVTTIQENFLANCTAFNSEIKKEGDAPIISIGHDFMNNCSAFNKQLTFVSDSAYIGANFLANASAFDNGSDHGAEGVVNTLEIKANIIGHDFLLNAKVFNSPITLTGTNTIYNRFLYGCKAFNQDIILPATLTKIFDYFMVDIDGFTSSIQVDCPMSSFIGGNKDAYFSSHNPGCTMMTSKFTFTGTYAEQAAIMFPNIDETTGKSRNNLFRNTANTQYPVLADYLAFEIGASDNVYIKVKNGCESKVPENLVIPETFVSGGVKYTTYAVAMNGFLNCTQVKTVEIPSSVKFIQANAFSINSLTDITFKDTSKNWESKGQAGTVDWTIVGKSSSENATFYKDGSHNTLGWEQKTA